MSEPNKDILKSVAAKMEAEGIPVPPSFTGKMTQQDSLLLHVFLDHIYLQVLPNLKQSARELTEFGSDNPEDSETVAAVLSWMEALVETLEQGYDYYADEIEAVPNLATMKAFREKLEEELEYAASISLKQLGKNGKHSN